jgi:nicotinate (nicotinamide) nucleotide adenylyltransferase
MKRIGIFSGTFDPMHIGHLEVCLVSKGALELDNLVVMIEKAPRRKIGVADYKHRKEIVELSLKDFDSINFMESSEDNVMVARTLEGLHKKFPGATYVLIIGSDMLDHLPDWPDFDVWAEKHELAVVLRDNKEKSKVEAALKVLQKTYPKLKTFTLPAVWSPVSSSTVKKELAKTGHSDLVHRLAMEYIAKQKLYSFSVSK